MWVSPINTAEILNTQIRKIDNWKLLRTSLPFSSFLTSRIFWGFDLDYRKEVYSDVEKGLNRILSPSYLGVVNVYYEDQKPIENQMSRNWQKI
jgi:hypothetical protein